MTQSEQRRREREQRELFRELDSLEAKRRRVIRQSKSLSFSEETRRLEEIEARRREINEKLLREIIK